MYEYIKGELAELTPAYAIVEAGGVGYYLNISLNTFSGIEGESQCRLYVHYIVREDAQILYGFSTKQEREIFRLLLGVSGVGGNTARMILSTYKPSEVTSIISGENAALLKNVKGLGLKTAQKIIVELKDKILQVSDAEIVPEIMGGVTDGVYSEALAALSMLGFPRSASDKVLRKLLKDSPGLPVEELIRMSLKHL